jgi:hypothetical protein
VIRTRGTFIDDQLYEVVGLLRDPERQIPRDALGDPWGRFITATAMEPPITRDRRITELRLVETIYYRRCLVSASAPRQDLVLDL